MIILMKNCYFGLRSFLSATKTSDKHIDQTWKIWSSFQILQFGVQREKTTLLLLEGIGNNLVFSFTSVHILTLSIV